MKVIILYYYMDVFVFTPRVIGHIFLLKIYMCVCVCVCVCVSVYRIDIRALYLR